MKKRFTYDKPRVGFAKGGFTDNLTGESYEFTIDQALDMMNKLHKENQILRDENEHGVRFANKIWGSILSMNNRDLTDIERVFFNNLIKEMGIDLNE